MSVMLDLDLADDLRGAHERGEIVLHFQPEIDLASGGVVGMEALMRWAHPRRGLLPPSSFLEVAHKAGLLLPLSTWVLEQCAAERATWEALPPHPTVGLCQLWANVPAVQLAATGFVDFVGELFERYPGDSEFVLEMHTRTGLRRLKFGESYRVAARNAALKAELDALLGAAAPAAA